MENIFQSTQPEWAATRRNKLRKAAKTISIHAARVGCDDFVCKKLDEVKISIHAARVGCDLICAKYEEVEDISIHAARVGCDVTAKSGCCFSKYFNPRSPSGLRPQAQKMAAMPAVISIHAARVGCDKNAKESLGFSVISIHAARVGCDRYCGQRGGRHKGFQSTQPEWAATKHHFQYPTNRPISIHAARVGCDWKQKVLI